MSTDLKATLTDIIRMIGVRISAYGYSTNHLALRKREERSTALIEFQNSTSSTKERVLFTVNLGILYNDLLDRPRSRNPSVWDAHMRLRLGHLLPERNDKWWELTSDTDAGALGEDLADAIEHLAVPYLDRYLAPKAVVALWETGASPGLTEFQRVRLLERLKAKTAS